MAAPKKNMGRYTEAERKAALELGATIGRRAAIRRLGISPNSFQMWTEMYPEFWSSLRAGDREVQRTRVAQNLEDLADSYSDMEFEALARAEKLIKTADAKELAALIKAMGSSRGVATVGARGYRGEDHQVTEISIDFPALEAAAQRILESAPQPALPVVNEAEVVSED